VTFAMLALVSLVLLARPLLALPQRWHLPIVVGEATVGVLLGRTAAPCRGRTSACR
jgi:Kef-type K+ transport system membrane component KefB